MKEGLKILLGIKGMDSTRGGAEKVMAGLASELVEHGHSVTLMTFDKPGGHSFYHVDPRVRRLSLGIGSTTLPSTVPEFLRRLPAIRRVVREERPDIVIGFMHSMYVLMGFSLLGLGVPILASEHIVPDYYRKRRFQYFLLSLSSFFIDRFAVLSDSIGDRYHWIPRRKLVTIPDPIYPATVYADPRGDGDVVKTVLNVGRLVDFKDQKTLIDAFAQVADSFLDWRLRIVGEGELRGELEARVVERGLEGRVQFPGSISAIEQEYAAAHIFVMSSIYEGFGMVTAEASSHGLPTVGFADCLGTNELIDDGKTGILVSGKDRVQNLATALRRLMSDAELRRRLGTSGIEKMRDYAPERIFDKWEQTIRSMTGGK